MELKCVDPADFEAVAAFYRYVSESTAEMAVYGRWIYGLHPTDEMIRGYLERGAMYALFDGDTVTAAMAVTMEQGEDYHDLSWGEDFRDDEVAVVHILCVDPVLQGRGLGKRMVEESIRLAQSNGKKAVRLDALASNTPAHRLYVTMGFQFRGKRNLYAENTGYTDFYFFERIL